MFFDSESARSGCFADRKPKGMREASWEIEGKANIESGNGIQLP
jgi:hypothetical protein